MGLQVFFVFSTAPPAVLDPVLKKWPGLIGRTVREPFVGIATRTPDLSRAESDEQAEQLNELALAIRGGLVEFSREHPGSPFLYLSADCAGGACIYEGFACRDGRTLLEAKGTRGDGTLSRLVAPLGVTSSKPGTRSSRRCDAISSAVTPTGDRQIRFDGWSGA